MVWEVRGRFKRIDIKARGGGRVRVPGSRGPFQRDLFLWLRPFCEVDGLSATRPDVL